MENNRLIAEFMGLRTNSYGDYNIDKDVMGFDMIVCSLADTKFHTSWDWLMPVVQKIEDYLSDNVGKVGYFDDGLVSNDIEVRYQAVVEFIKQHKTYPFNEGDDYWVVEDGDLVWGVWDDVSEEIHDESPDRIYFTEEEAIDYARANGIKYNKRSVNIQDRKKI